MRDLKVLGIDSSARSVGVAVCEGRNVLAQMQLNIALTHSQTLLPAVNSCLEQARISLNDIGLFAVSAGPGSFTGLRIAVSAVKGLAFAADKPCVAVSTLKALAYNLLGFDGTIVAAMDARCSQVYTALFRADGKSGTISRISDDLALPLSELGKMLENHTETIFFVGDGADLCYNILGQKENFRLAPPHLEFQSGFGVCMSALNATPCSAGELSLKYLRLPQAERERLAKIAENTAKI